MSSARTTEFSLRAEGAVLALGAGGAVAYAHVWAGQQAPFTLVLPLALLVSSALGALAWGLFQPSAEQRAGVGFAALFAGTVGLLAGAWVAFPLGAFGGAVGGMAAGAAGLWALRRWSWWPGVLASVIAGVAVGAFVLG